MKTELGIVIEMDTPGRVVIYGSSSSMAPKMSSFRYQFKSFAPSCLSPSHPNAVLNIRIRIRILLHLTPSSQVLARLVPTGMMIPRLLPLRTLVEHATATTALFPHQYISTQLSRPSAATAERKKGSSHLRRLPTNMFSARLRASFLTLGSAVLPPISHGPLMLQ